MSTNCKSYMKAIAYYMYIVRYLGELKRRNVHILLLITFTMTIPRYGMGYIMIGFSNGFFVVISTHKDEIGQVILVYDIGTYFINLIHVD